MAATAEQAGSAQHQGSLWGARPSDWAAVEEVQAPTYEEAMRLTGLSRGQTVLDVGCGTGVFLRRAAEAGARVFGLDAAETLVELARERVPEAEVRVGDLQFLPYEDDAFDVVTGFNSFFFAADMVAALREAGRVTRPDGHVLIQVWGRTERCDLARMLEALAPLRPSAEEDTPPPAPLSQPGVLEGIAGEAGLTPLRTADVRYPIEFPDRASLLSAMLGAGGVVEAVRTSGEPRVREAIVASLEPFRTADGGYRLENEWHYLLASP